MHKGKGSIRKGFAGGESCCRGKISPAHGKEDSGAIYALRKTRVEDGKGVGRLDRRL